MADTKLLFRSLVNQQQRLIYSQAVHILADAIEAEDACQEAYERLWKHLNKGRSGDMLDMESGKAWLLHVTRNLCIDKLRQRRPVVTDGVEDSLCDEPGNGPSSTVAHSELSKWLRQTIAKLKEPYRSLITHADLQQRPVKEVARMLELSENQAKVYIHRGRRQLRDLLQGVEL
ncbi:MAG: RNA polymerase sigma factor [Pseudomonadales bacterium]